MKRNSDIFNQVIRFIVYHGKIIEKVFLVTTILCAICFPFVGVNYDLSKYLPDFAPTKQALDVMEAEFGYPGMARIRVKDVSLQEAKRIREEISAVDGVDLVLGSDVSTDVYMGAPFLNESMTEFIGVDLLAIDDYYKDGNALMDIVFEDKDGEPRTNAAIEEIYRIVGKDRGCFAGSAVSSKEREASITREITMAIAMSIVIIWLILTLTTTSWMEPFLFIFVMIVAIVLNMGSNIVFGTISFFTFSTAAILQLAVSMDYSIFLLHTFTALKNRGMESCSSILASGATTIVGFIVIAFMRFTIGKDVGFVLAKGIICSLLTVLLLMPTLILRFDDKIVKTAHKPLIASFDGFARAMYKIRVPVFLLAALLAVPCYFGQSMNKFLYGDDAIGAGPGTRVYEDTQEINSLFKKSNMTICIVPNGSSVTEKELAKELENLDFVNYVISMSGTMPNGIPESFLPEDLTSQLRNEDYARMLISMDTLQESDYAFECSARLEEVVHKYYPDHSYVIGMTPTTIDIRDILTEDYNNVSLLSLAGVALVVFITFRSILVPILVIVPIEVAIYLNMTLPYVMGDSMIYIGYIIVSCLQLGATIDYSILMTNNYLAFRKEKGRREAAVAAVNKSTLSIMTSGGILMVVGYLLYFTSSIQAISQVGRLVGRGAFLSVTLVLSLLPALLSAFDKQIKRQQEKADARKERRRKRLAAAKNLTGARNVASKKSEVPEKNLTPAERPAPAAGKGSPEENITPAQNGESDQKEKGDDSHEEE